MRLTSIRGHHVWTTPLDRESIVVDAGAHRGEFSSAIIQRYGSRCFLIEANPELASALAVPGAEQVVPGALTAHGGRAQFGLRSSNIESGSVAAGFSTRPTPGTSEIDAWSLESLMTKLRLDRIDLLKLDIEGEEFELIDATPPDVWRRVRQLTVEFHDFMPLFAGRDLFEKARKKLETIGFVSAVISFRTHGDVLFLNQESHPLSLWASLYFRYWCRVVAKAQTLRGREG